MNDLYEALEVCLQEIEGGADIDTVVFRYPDLADELRPILEASVNAMQMAVPSPSTEVVWRNRAKVLQHAAQLREAKVGPSSPRIWSVSLRRVAVTLVVIAALFVSGTGLVRAASTTLPGDNLYPVKRTWEDVRLLFTFDLQRREALEIEHESERLQELEELFAEGRTARVDFAGLVMSQTGSQWMISGIPVLVSPQTELRNGPIVVDSPVRVKGLTQASGAVLAERIELLPAGAKLPNAGEDEHGIEKENNSGKGSEREGPEAKETEKPESNSRDDSSNSGSGSRNSGSGSDDGGSSGGNSNDNSGSGGHGGDDSGSNENSNDSGGGGGKSGPGGGGDD